MYHSLKETMPFGAYCDLITPFRNNRVDENAIETLVGWQIDNGISGILVCGMAGEPTALSGQERTEIARVALQAAKRQVPVIVGAGTNSTVTTIEFAAKARELGAAAVEVVTPYYNRPSQEGLFQHYRSIADAVDLPIIVCNAPDRTATDIKPALLERLSEIRSIIGFRDCTGDLGRLAATPLSVRKRLRHFSGHDHTAHPYNLSGGAGTFSRLANIAPRQVCAMHDALRTGNLDAAFTFYERLQGLASMLDADLGPSALKQILHYRMGISPEVRLPLMPVDTVALPALRQLSAAMSAGAATKRLSVF